MSANRDLAKLASPTTHVDSADPPMLILHWARDRVVGLDQSELLRDRYQAANGNVTLHVEPEGGHGWRTTLAERELVLSTLREWFSASRGD